jgi:threonine dehydratase
MSEPVLPPTPAQLDEARQSVARHLVPTPTVTLSARGRPVYAKLESLQPTGSFKVRGAIAAISAARDRAPAVITSSAGNHGLGIAQAAALLDVRATVVVPANASAAKVAQLRQFDVELIQVGSTYDEAQAHAKDLAERRSIYYISPFNNTYVMAGQATVFSEMIAQAPDLEHLVVSVGGGGLLSGVLLSRDELRRTDVRVTGVQPENSAALYQVLHGATMETVVHRPTIADGLAGGGDDDAATNAVVAEHGVKLVLVPEIDLRRAVREVAETSGLVLEGSATASYAAIVHNLIDDPGGRVGFIATGRNIAHDLLLQILAEPLG